MCVNYCAPHFFPSALGKNALQNSETSGRGRAAQSICFAHLSGETAVKQVGIHTNEEKAFSKGGSVDALRPLHIHMLSTGICYLLFAAVPLVNDATLACDPNVNVACVQRHCSVR